MIHDVFISFKNNDENGRRTIDSEIAKKLYDFLTEKGLRVFFSNIELEFTGKAQYSKVINEALDSSRFLIAVGSSYKNLNSEWVYYEWDSFLNDIRSGIKPNAEVFVLYSGIKVGELPRALRQQQAFDADEKDSFEKLYRFIKNALGVTTVSTAAPVPKAPVAKEVKPTAKQPIALKSKRLLTIALSLALIVGLVFCGIALWGKRAGTDSVTNSNSRLLTSDKGIQKQMTMETTKFGNAELRLAGSGNATIDWGDGSDIETHSIHYYHVMGWSSDQIFSHYYTDTISRTITISGEDITYMVSNDNKLTSLDVSKYITLISLTCSSNKLTNLDVSKNTALTSFAFSYNSLTSLDLSKNTALTALECNGNPLKNLDLSKNTMLNFLFCKGNQLISLDVSKNTRLRDLDCSNNLLANLDLSKNIALEYLTCKGNQFSDTALNALFETLNSYSDTKSIWIGDNPGTETCNRSIAEKKGWKFIN